MIGGYAADLTAVPHLLDADERVMWLYGFRACEVADHTGREAFRVAAQSRFAARPHDVPLHLAHTAHLAVSRGWPVLTADPAGWAGYDHLELVHL
ncbi:hypothetical protein [Planobispora longispora]|uniref:PIN domain-containing protein n=1 Tax=Planobispora longispora TaxID=28887 RepID=A0A8J3RWW4_9ACTN|nr:hypothetical protein [Planobispora longispora]BFE88348.1 hypothetical protein GCM10020093_109490 [Planobispora longispora]GIH79663.1 hypothetical protein Plo01_60920 [Planobispora longispora]